MINLVALSKEGKAFLSPMSSKCEQVSEWRAFGEQIESICGSFCGSIFSVINGELFSCRTSTSELTALSRIGVECTSASIGGTSIVIKTADRVLHQCAFDPVAGQILSPRRQLALMKRSDSLDNCPVLISLRDHVFYVNPKGEAYFLQEQGILESDEQSKWVQIAVPPPETELRRGFLGRASSFIQSLTRSKKKYCLESVCLCANSLWLSCSDKPSVFRLELPDPDSLSRLLSPLKWVVYDIEDGCKIVGLCGSPDEPVLWGVDQGGQVKRYSPVLSSDSWILRSKLVPFPTGQFGVRELTDVCVAYERKDSSPSPLPSSPIPQTPSAEQQQGQKQEEENPPDSFEEPLSLSSLNDSLKYSTRYCCSEGDCDTCQGMRMAEEEHSLLQRMENVPSSSSFSATTLLSPRKRPYSQAVAVGSKRRKSCLNKHYLLDGVWLELQTPPLVAMVMQGHFKSTENDPIPTPIVDFLKWENEKKQLESYFQFAFNVVNQEGEYVEPLKSVFEVTPPPTPCTENEVFATAMEFPFPVQVEM